jgi:UDP-glucose 4-epimerase
MVFYPFLAKAKEELGWEATQNVNKMCADLWRFQRLNPQGYADNNND